MLFWEFFGTVSAIAEALFAERDKCVPFSRVFLVFNFWLADRDISIKTNNTNIVDDGKPRVLWHRIKT
jgi:hypothetical protein